MGRPSYRTNARIELVWDAFYLAYRSGEMSEAHIKELTGYSQTTIYRRLEEARLRIEGEPVPGETRVDGVVIRPPIRGGTVPRPPKIRPRFNRWDADYEGPVEERIRLGLRMLIEDIKHCRAFQDQEECHGPGNPVSDAQGRQVETPPEDEP